MNLTPAERSPLVINTFDGKRSPYHPSVLFFEEGWSGWRYWMAETPFSHRTQPYIDRNECPSIHVSNDGVNWTEPVGVTNPLEDLSAEQVKELDYFSDPCLVKGPVGRVELWYRLTQRRGEVHRFTECSLRRRVSIDGVNWSPVEVMAQLNLNQSDEGLGNAVVSPAIRWDEEHGYRMWFGHAEQPGPLGISFSTSKDGRTWVDKTVVGFDREHAPWHLDVCFEEGKWLMTVYGDNKITLWEGDDELNFRYRNTLVTPSGKRGAINNSLYKACLLKDGEGYKLYYSGADGVDTHVALMTGSDLASLSPYNTNALTPARYWRTYLYHQQRRLRFVLKNLTAKLLK